MNSYLADTYDDLAALGSINFKVIAVDKARGHGVVALRNFSSGDALFQMNGEYVPQVTQFSLQLGPNLHMEDLRLAGKVLHSCQPNSMLEVDTRWFVAVQDIVAGDLLTMDYEQTEDVLFKGFVCRCGSPVCRGQISGRHARTALIEPAVGTPLPELSGEFGVAS